MERPSPATLTFLLLSVLFNVGSQLLVKKGMLEIGVSPTQAAGMLPFLWRAFSNPKVLAGGLLAFCTMGCWMIALSRTALSFAYPFYTLAIVLVLALSPVLFKETVRWHQWFGVAFVCFGIWIASRNL